MNKNIIVMAALVSTLAITSCSITDLTSKSAVSDMSSSSSEETVATNNVSYTGILGTIAQSDTIGTHQLTLSDSSTILLLSSDLSLNLDAYIGKTVEVRGSAEPVGTISGRGMRPGR